MRHGNQLMNFCENMEKIMLPCTYDLLPRVPTETERFFYMGPSISSFGSLGIDMRLIIETTNQTYSALKENVSIYQWIYRKNMGDVERAAIELVDLMKNELKKAGLLAYDKKPDPEPLPDWLAL